MTYAVGSLVKARGREWVVLPESSDDLLMLRPLGGTDDEVTGIALAVEGHDIAPASFDLPDPSDVGDHRSCRLLRDAVRLGFRSSAGPFRSFARLGCEPRPYQLVPLLMALKLDPVRLLIADDVGIGKTVEAALVARELMDRGEVHRLAVLCPPHLAEQWQAELRDKFHIDCELVLPSTVRRLERHCTLDRGVFDVYPHVIVSMDFIKSDRHRADFLRACPELVIVDEAHSCAFAGGRRGGGRHQRHELVRGLASDAARHMIFVTATPHSGNEESFRSLLAFLDEDFANLPEDLAGKANERHRRRLAAHFVQRRRAHIRHFMDADTPFPDRQERDESYKLSADYRALFDKVLEYARETVRDASGTKHRQRVRWWSALALLRSLASSPAAAAATLRSRAAPADTTSEEEADEVGKRTVLDLEPEESAEAVDASPGSDPGGEGSDDHADADAETRRVRKRLQKLAREADALEGAKDQKLKQATKLLKSLLADGFRPIVFCRFIPTAEYVARELRGRLKKGVEVAAVTGTLPPAEREERILQLTDQARADGKLPVLVCTDCLSEGINLQDHFNAVVHYDLSWNPTRHEQREGRVDRYGQPSPTVRVLTYYGIDNQIDGIVLDVILQKHKKIRNSLGYSVPVPVDTNAVMEAVFEGLLLREGSGAQAEFDFIEDLVQQNRLQLAREWDSAVDREKWSRTVFAQESIKVDEVSRELAEVRGAVGAGVEVERFVRQALELHGAVVESSGSDTRAVTRFGLEEVPRALADRLGAVDGFEARFELPVDDGVLHLHRTHPVVEGIASHVMDTALDPQLEGVAKRSGVIRTRLVECRTTVLLARFGYHIVKKRAGEEFPLLAEDCQLLAFEGSPQSPSWLEAEAAERLLGARPDGNVAPAQATDFLRKVVDGFDGIRPHLEDTARSRGDELLEAHRRVRTESRQTGVTFHVEPKLPPDMLGLFIYLPAGGR